jgi:chemotaxis protein methyltransferase CheR
MQENRSSYLVDTLTESIFNKYAKLIYDISGIYMKPEKRTLIENRLQKRLRTVGVTNFESYLSLVNRDAKELQEMLNIITTNETSFFREPKHFEFLKNVIMPNHKDHNIRVWSAACSVGAEAYSTAMVLDYYTQNKRVNWEIIATDINTDVLTEGATGLYPMKFTRTVDEKYLKKYCLRGHGKQEGYFLIDDYLKKGVAFQYANLMEEQSRLGKFDLIFLRNMLIYFDNKNKKHIVENVAKNLKKGGYLFLGHSETLFNITNILKQVQPTIYRKEF